MDNIRAKLRLENIVAWVVIFFVIIFHIFLISKTFVIDREGNFRTAFSGYGDIPFHMTQVSKFAFENTINFNEPIFDGERMRYAFFINLLSGLILKATSNWFLAMQIPAMTFMAGGTILIFSVYKTFLKSHFRALVALIIFLFGSGFGANAFIVNDLINSKLSLGQFSQHLVNINASTIIKWDAIFPDQNIVWGAPLSLVFLHQRAFILGFFMFTLFIFFFEKWRKNTSSISLLTTCGIIVGITPLAHYHSFIAMCVVLFTFGIQAIFKRNKLLILRLFILGIVVLIFALPQIIYLVQGKNSIIFAQQAFMKFRIGWMTEPGTSFVIFNPLNHNFLTGVLLPYFNFLWINFGFVLPIFLLCLLYVLKSFHIRKYYCDILFWAISGLILFALVQLVRFQPWDFDDNKILVYFQFFAAPVMVASLAWLFGKSKLLLYLSMILFVLITTYSGIIDQVPRFLAPVDNLPIIFNVNSIRMAEYIKKEIPQQNPIITSSSHLNLVSSLAGRPVIVGYPGWLWTRGISYSNRENDLRNFFANPIQYNYIAQKYGANYVLLDPSGVYDWHIDKSIFDNQFTLINKNGDYSLYKIN